jgi:GntR family transcriptional regulator, transcriptional repressor for pyruvate dehydrogenase complex
MTTASPNSTSSTSARSSLPGSTFTVRVPKAAELVVAHIRKRIVRGELSEGEALPPEGVLMEEFRISRPTLREAFRILESEGLITVRRGAHGGARVQIPTSDVAARYAGLVLQYRGTTLRDVFEARVVVEAPAAGILAGRRDHVRSAARLGEWLEERRDQPTVEWFHEFNRLVVSLTRNETLVLVTTMLESICDAVLANYLAVRHPNEAKLDAKAHKGRVKLISLIERGEAENAEALWRDYLSEAGKELMGARGATVVDVLAG